MNTQKRTKFIMNIVILLAVFVIIIYLVQNSLAEILQELTTTNPLILLAIFLLGLANLFFDGWSIKEIVSSFSKKFRIFDGVLTTWYVAFYRVITFGAGTLVSEVNFYNRKDLKVSQGMGVTSLHMIMHKAAILTYGIIAFILQFSLIYTHAPNSIPFILLGMLMTLAIILFFLVISLSTNLQVIFIIICNRLFKKAKFREVIDRVNLQIYSLRETVSTVLQDRTALIRVYLLSMIKLALWYIIPFICLMDGQNEIDFLLIFSLVSFTLVLSGVIPSPAGIGAFEFVYLYLFTPVVGTVDAVSSLLLYRFASYLLPFILGFVQFMIERKRVISNELEELKTEKELSQ